MSRVYKFQYNVVSLKMWRFGQIIDEMVPSITVRVAVVCTHVQVHVDATWPHQPWLNDATGKGSIGSDAGKWRPPTAQQVNTGNSLFLVIVHIWSKCNFPIGVYNYRSIELCQCCCLLSIFFKGCGIMHYMELYLELICSQLLFSPSVIIPSYHGNRSVGSSYWYPMCRCAFLCKYTVKLCISVVTELLTICIMKSY